MRRCSPQDREAVAHLQAVCHGATVQELSDNARRLWRLVSERPAPYTLDEIKADLNISKTALLRAAHELEEAGIVSSWMEEPK